MSSVHYVDIIILVIFCISIVVGLSRGLISEVVSLVTLIAAITVGIIFTAPLANYFTQADSIQKTVTHTSTAMGVSTAEPTSYLAYAISFALLFAGTIIIGVIIKALLNLAFTTGVVGIGNRLLGGLFGFVRGFLINLVIIFVVQLSPLSNEDWWHQSRYVPYFQPSVDWLASIISPHISKLGDTFHNNMLNKTKEGVTKIQSNF